MQLLPHLPLLQALSVSLLAIQSIGTLPIFLLQAEVIRGVRLILRAEPGKMKAQEVCPKLLPAIAQNQGSKGENSLPAINGPSHS